MKDLINFENISKIFAGLITYFGMLATPEKLLLVSCAIFIICIGLFAVWAFFQLKKEIGVNTELRELFERRYLVTEARTKLLTDIHIERHDDDGKKFFKLERELATKTFNELKAEQMRLCGSCKDSDD